jgi:hypothetical protein
LADTTALSRKLFLRFPGRIDSNLSRLRADAHEMPIEGERREKTGETNGSRNDNNESTVVHNQRDGAEPPLAAASVANIENCFIRSKLDFTAASGWLQQLVRWLAFNCPE